jgi:DNA-binding NarL/FixJ family response regulator
MAIRILLADDHRVLREGLRRLLESEEDLEVVAEAGNGVEVLDLAKKCNPDVVIMDIQMPEMNGLQAARLILKENNRLKVIVLSMMKNEELVIQALQAGVKGYLLKENASSEIVLAIKEVMKGNAYYEPSISKVISKHFSQTDPKDVELTLLEKEILQFIADGKTSKEICILLKMNIKTVEKYRQRLMNKLNLHDVASLTKYAVNKGIVVQG